MRIVAKCFYILTRRHHGAFLLGRSIGCFAIAANYVDRLDCLFQYSRQDSIHSFSVKRRLPWLLVSRLLKPRIHSLYVSSDISSGREPLAGFFGLLSMIASSISGRRFCDHFNDRMPGKGKLLNCDHLHLILLFSDRSQIHDRAFHRRKLTGHVFRYRLVAFVSDDVEVGLAHFVPGLFRLFSSAAICLLCMGQPAAHPGVTPVTAHSAYSPSTPKNLRSISSARPGVRAVLLFSTARLRQIAAPKSNQR
jgi:hypothetical protein